MDQFYFESGYFDGRYFVYVAEARLSSYIPNDYFANGYLEDGNFYNTASVSAELTRIPTEFAADLSSAVVLSCQGNKTVSADSSVSSSFNSTCVISHIEGADLFAFAEATIAVAIDRIRDNDITASAVFDVAVDFVRTLSADADAVAEHTLSTDVQRNRDSQSQLEVAFSFASSAQRLRDSSSNQSAESTLSGIITRIQQSSIDLSSVAEFSAEATVTSEQLGEAQLSSQFQLTADVGLVKTSAVNLSSESTVSISIDDLTKDADADLVSSSTLACVISHIEGADIIVNGFASITIDASKSVVSSGSLISGSTVNAEANRTRSAQSSSALVASLTAAIDGIIQVSSNLSVISALSIQTSKTIPGEVSAECVSTLSSTILRIRTFDSEQYIDQGYIDADYFQSLGLVLDSSAELSGVISHIEGTDIVLNNFASVACAANSTASADSQLESTADIGFNGGLLTTASSNLHSNTNIFLSRKIGLLTDRPMNLLSPAGSDIFDTVDKKFGSASLTNATLLSPIDKNIVPSFNEDFYIEWWLYYGRQGNINIGTTYWISSRILSNNRLSISFQLPNSTTVYPTPGYIYTSADNFLSIGNWYHIAVAKTNTDMSYYVNGSRVYTVNDSMIPRGTYGNYWGSADSGSEFTPFDRITINVLALNNLDELFYIRNSTLGINPTQTTIPIPNSARENSANVGFLYHFDGNIPILDDVTLRQTGTANISSAFTQTVTLSGVVNVVGNLTTTATLSAKIGTLEDIELIAFSDAEVTTDADRVRNADSAVASASSLLADLGLIKLLSVQASSEVSMDVIGSAVRDADIDTQSIATNLAIVSKIGDVLIDVNSTATATITASKTTDIGSTATAESTVLISAARTRGITEDITSDTALVGSATRIKQLSSDTTAQTTVSAQATKDAVFASDLASEFTVMADASGGTVRAIALLASLGDITVIPEVTRTTAGTLDSEVSTNVVAVKSVDAQADAPAQTNLDLDYIRFRSAQISTDSIGTLLSVVVKTTDEDANLESVFTLAVNAAVTTESVISAQALCGQAATAVKTTDVESDQLVVTELTAEGTTNIVAQGVLVSQAALSCLAQTTTETILSAFSDAAVTTTVSVTRDIGAISVASEFTVADVDTTLFVPFASAVDSEFTLDATINKTVDSGVLVFDSLASTLSVGRLVNIDMKVYVIPEETRRYIIDRETNTYAIGEETRIFQIRSTK